jgi:hypothetical protein
MTKLKRVQLSPLRRARKPDAQGELARAIAAGTRHFWASRGRATLGRPRRGGT